MNIIIWVVQGILASLFMMAGFMKISQSKDKLMKSGLGWVERFPLSTIKFIGTSELLGAIGMILPLALGILLLLTPVAATGIALIMIFASFHHLKHKEFKEIAINTVLFLLAAFVAYSRFVVLFR